MNAYAMSDSRAIVRAALSDLVTHGLSALSNWLRQPRNLDYDDARIIDRDDDVDYAAALLGVRADASPDEVRAAFRRAVKVEMATNGDFHDRGGDATDPRAQELIAAKNLLIARAQEASHVA